MSRRKSARVVEDTGAALKPEMPMPAMNVTGQVAMNVITDQGAKEAFPDPHYQEGISLREEAVRALRRLVTHEATVGQQYRLSSAVKALEALRGY